MLRGIEKEIIGPYFFDNENLIAEIKKIIFQNYALTELWKCSENTVTHRDGAILRFSGLVRQYLD